MVNYEAAELLVHLLPWMVDDDVVVVRRAPATTVLVDHNTLYEWTDEEKAEELCSFTEWFLAFDMIHELIC